VTFELNPQLEADTFLVRDWPFCRVLLMNDTSFAWLILVPREVGLRDFHDVAPKDETNFLGEINQAARRLKVMTGADKMNVAALGNMVPQLHIHIIARFESDAAWPGPVWGAFPAIPYEDQVAKDFIEAFNGFEN
jgi:diadenosine tetraphosphate (Ap4A) HIT family hydrolase